MADSGLGQCLSLCVISRPLAEWQRVRVNHDGRTRYGRDTRRGEDAQAEIITFGQQCAVGGDKLLSDVANLFQRNIQRKPDDSQRVVQPLEMVVPGETAYRETCVTVR